MEGGEPSKPSGWEVLFPAKALSFNPFLVGACSEFRSADFKVMRPSSIRESSYFFAILLKQTSVEETLWLGQDSAVQMLPSTQSLIPRPAAGATEQAWVTEH